MAAIDFRSTMRRYPDQELIRIVHHGADEDLDPQAIAAASAELSARNVSQKQSADLLEEVEATRIGEMPRENLELSKASRILFIPFGFFLIIPAIAAATFLGAIGYKKKSQQAWISVAIGAAGLALMVFILLFVH